LFSSKLFSFELFSSELVISEESSSESPSDQLYSSTYSTPVSINMSVLSAKDWCVPKLFKKTLAIANDNTLYKKAPEINPKTYFL
jgi:hypothetical protein